MTQASFKRPKFLPPVTSTEEPSQEETRREDDDVASEAGLGRELSTQVRTTGELPKELVAGRGLGLSDSELLRREHRARQFHR